MRGDDHSFSRRTAGQPLAAARVAGSPVPHGPRDRLRSKIFARRKTGPSWPPSRSSAPSARRPLRRRDAARLLLTDMADAVDGFVSEKVSLEWKGPGGGAEGSTAAGCRSEASQGSQTHRSRAAAVEEIGRRPFKITLPAPSNFVVASYKPGLTDAFYPTHADLLRDLVDIVRDEVRWLCRKGYATSSSTRHTTRTIWIHSNAIICARQASTPARNL